MDEVYVSTDDAQIAELARQHGAHIIARPVELSTDEATSESALLHALSWLDSHASHKPDLLVFLQCTSPVRRPSDIDNAIQTLLQQQADSLFSAARFHRLIWGIRGGQPFSINYDFHQRQREQDMAIQYQENGSIYVLRPHVLRQYGNRLGGKIAICEMDIWSTFQVDTPEDAAMVQWILEQRQRPTGGAQPALTSPVRRKAQWSFASSDLYQQFQQCTPSQLDLIVFDFDGVMTDNRVIVDQSGAESVVCHRGDGLGVDQLKRAGIQMIVLSTESNPVVACRCEKLGLPCYQGIGDKREFLKGHLQTHGFAAQNVVYLGNDVNDLSSMQLVGCPIAVADAHPDVIGASKVILTRRGGDGAVRQLADLVLAHRRTTEAKAA